MTRSPLRLVLDQGEDTAAAVELPSAGPSDLHIHLHLGVGAHEPLEMRSGIEANGRPGKGRWRPVLLGAAGVLIAFVAFDVGARTGEGHARALAASRSSAEGLASLIGRPQSALEAPTPANEMPAAVRQQLAQRPTITPPPAEPSASPNPFGLHP